MCCKFAKIDRLMSRHMQNLIKFYRFVLKIHVLSGNKILTKTKDHNFVVNLRKLTRNNPNVDLLNANAYAYANFVLILSIRSQEIERKRNSNYNQ